jgi:hypothetical protein
MSMSTAGNDDAVLGDLHGLGDQMASFDPGADSAF